MPELRSLAPGVGVPCVGLGTWLTFDVRSPAERATRGEIVNEALAAGVKVFDSSPMYGEAERLVGELLRERRDQAFIATKVWTASAEEGRRQAERALGWFGGRVDLYQVHNLTATDVQLALLEELRAEGSVRLIGATHYSSPRFGELAALMRNGRVDAVQVPYNPRERDIEREILPLAEERGIGVLVMRPLAQGALMRKPPPAADLRALGVKSWAEALIKWVLSDRRCTCAIPATSKPGRVSENARAGEPPWFGEDERAYVARLTS